MKRYVHDDHRLLKRYRRDAGDTPRPQSSSSSSSRVYSSHGPADPTDAWALRGFPVIVPDGVGGTMPGTDPERALERKAENEGW